MNWKKRTIFTRGLILFLLLLLGIGSVLAALPANGTVVEGQSVPGTVELGFTRSQVEAVWGSPTSCQGPEQDFCTYHVDGNLSAAIFVSYQAVQGNSRNDILFAIRWSQGVSGWTTTAGINTDIALNNPDAVLAAYPNAEVTYTQSGSIFRVRDFEAGIEVTWNSDYLSGTVFVDMVIFAPRPAPPPPSDKVMYVESIEMATGRREVSATVHVLGDDGLNVFGATVSATWSMPRGQTQTVTGTTDSFGRVTFTLDKARQGDYTLTINNVTADGYSFDANNSVLSASISL